MAELTLQERLQPSLLDRLRDDRPDRQEESPNERVLTLSQLKRSVQRDISWLLNACNNQDMVADYPEVVKSVVNFGIPDLAGLTASTVDVVVLERTIQQALADFEPRLMKNSIRLNLQVDPETMSFNTLIMNIECDLWATPTPVEMLLRTAVDLETGEVVVDDKTGTD